MFPWGMATRNIGEPSAAVRLSRVPPDSSIMDRTTDRITPDSRLDPVGTVSDGEDEAVLDGVAVMRITAA